jgi:hypothetical protein
MKRSKQRICPAALVQIETEKSAEVMAERVGFEPTVEFPQHTLSKRAP